jgi:hypothetical protein
MREGKCVCFIFLARPITWSTGAAIHFRVATYLMPSCWEPRRRGGGTMANIIADVIMPSGDRQIYINIIIKSTRAAGF